MPFHYGSKAIIKFNHDSNEVVVIFHKVRRLLFGRLWCLGNNNNNSNANGNNNLDNNNGRLVGIVKLLNGWLGHFYYGSKFI